MALCPVCGNQSAGKRIAYGNCEIMDLCNQCAANSDCLINPNADIRMKQDAIRWADAAIERNREKTYLANSLISFRQSAESFIAANTPRYVPEYENVNSYSQPAPVYTPAPVRVNASPDPKGMSKTFWATFIKVLTIFFGVVIFLGCTVYGVIAGIEMGDYRDEIFYVLLPLAGVLVGALASMLIMCGGMFMVETAKNIAKANNSINELKAEIRELKNRM